MKNTSFDWLLQGVVLIGLLGIAKIITYNTDPYVPNRIIGWDGMILNNQLGFLGWSTLYFADFNESSTGHFEDLPFLFGRKDVYLPR